MKIRSTQSEETVLAELGARLAQRRLSRNLTQADLARVTGLSKRTIERVEDSGSAQLSTLVRLARALDFTDGLDALVPETPPSPLDMARMQGQRRQRSSPRPASANPPAPWRWGDEP